MKMKVIVIYGLTVILIVILLISIIYPIFSHTENGPSVSTRHRLFRLQIYIQCAHADIGSWPDENNWKEKLTPYLSKQDLEYNIFRDDWGNDIKYINREDANGIKRLVYSFGKNGRDDLGKGDDIIVEIEE